MRNNTGKCLECSGILEAHEEDFCNECQSSFGLNGGVEMFDFASELSYGN